jgi:hypothetical protein
MALVAHRFTQAGSPSHRSQISGRSVSGCSITIPKGHSSAQAEQPMQSSASTRTTPMTSSRYRASVGQATTQAGRRHRRQTLGTSSPRGSILVTLMRAVAVPNWPSWRATQATSQARQPLHTSFRVRSRFKVSPHHLEVQHKNQATGNNELFTRLTTVERWAKSKAALWSGRLGSPLPRRWGISANLARPTGFQPVSDFWGAGPTPTPPATAVSPATPCP